MKSAFRNDSDAKGIHCPVCRDFLKKPEKSNVDTWAADLPGNHLLVSIIDMNKSKEESSCCNACQRQGKSEEAKSWCINCGEAMCETCERCHNNLKLGTLHKVIPIDKLDTSGSPLQSLDIYCSDHPERKLEAYCSDHSIVCCMSCVMLKHRKCEDVGSVEDVTKTKKSSGEIKILEKAFCDMKDELQKLVETRTRNKYECEESIASMRSEVDKLFKNVIGHYETLRDNVHMEINATEKHILPLIEQEKDELQCKISAIENDLQLLQTNSEHAAPAQFLQSLVKLNEQNRIMEIFLMKMKLLLENISITFKANKHIEEAMRTTSKGGVVAVHRTEINLNRSESPKIDMLTAEPKLIRSIGSDYNSQGIAFLEDGSFLISRNESQSLELWDSTCTLVSSLKVPGYPYGIKMFNGREGAVALKHKALLFFEVYVNAQIIRETKRIQVPITNDFTFCNGYYYIGSQNKIIVLDESLQRVRDIAVDAEVGYITSLSDTRLCYTLYGHYVLHCITLGGSRVFQYSNDKLQGTKGITLDCSGNIYVSGYKSKNIHQLSSDGKLQRILFRHLPAKPYSIGFNKAHSKAVILCNTCVLLYSLS